jgi:5-methylcytosine-specific restriction endonuclease McrA
MDRSEQAASALKWFWHQFRRERQTTYRERLIALKDFAERSPVIKRPMSPEAKRRHFKASVDWVPNGSCFLCREAKATVRHHIIPISRGGCNRIINLVGLCAPCHAEIHPWLKKPVAVVVHPVNLTPKLVRR